ncbi:hypothetical protein BLA60_01120 [Actinophytocola xinjiangensis]|uniref:Secreted protein n=1 Tax=Actinophytocola xinjiangensis TaxID=485602 RepID=A0A7Z0WSF0_9PSEU|nr:hypothetical protein BLA60_01120 [Actinophytocola xinjiangensis]
MVETDRPARPTRAERVAELNSLARTTPGVLTVLTGALVLVSILVGVLTAVGVRGRSAALEDLAQRSGPLSVAAQDIYRALSDADVTATSAFLSSGAESAELRNRYLTDIAQAESAIAVAVAAREPAEMSVGDGPLDVLSTRLSVYTGIIERARANNLQGFPVGASDQQMASNLMRTELLPAAEELFAAESARLAADQDRADGFPVVEVVLGIIALAILIITQVYLRRTTRRVFNVGLLVATGAALVSVLWVLIAVLGVSHNVDQSRAGSERIGELTETRIAALTARANETLTLVARGSGGAFNDEFDEIFPGLESRLGEAGLPDAETAWAKWKQVHDELREADDGGDYGRAVDLAVGEDANGARTHFDAVDEDLGTALGESNTVFTDEISQASNAVTGTVIGVIVLAVLMAVGSATGIWQRLKEYR